jgi:hypothetical protein
MIGALITFIVYLLVIGILYYMLIYVVDNFIPEPPARMVKAAGVVFLCIVVIILLLGLVGVGGINVPKLAI